MEVRMGCLGGDRVNWEVDQAQEVGGTSSAC